MNAAKVVLVLLFAVLEPVATEDQLLFFDNTDLNNGKSLGTFPYQCIGDINFCPGGFTIALWLKFGANAISSASYVLSSGGQSILSEGYYIRKNWANELECGVTKNSQKWSAKVPVFINQSWTHVAYTWSLNNGLVIYIDGYAIKQVKTPSSREFVKMDFDPYPNVTIGFSNDQNENSSKLTFSLNQLLFTNFELNNTAIYSVFEDNLNRLIVSCSDTKPSLSISESGNIATTSSLDSCRTFCLLKFYNGILFKKTTSCDCLSGQVIQSAQTNLPSSAAGQNCLDSSYILSWATHQIINDSRPINLDVDIMPPKSIFNVTENILLTFRTQTNDSLVFIIDFKDGFVIETRENVISHSWSEKGKYTINVTAKSCFTTEARYVDIEIINNQTGPPPLDVSIKTDVASMDMAVGQVNYYLSAYSNQAKNCSVSLDRNAIKVYTEASQFVLAKNDSYIFNSVGFYNVSALCSNIFSSSSQMVVAVSSCPNVFFKSLPFSTTDNLSLALTNAQNNFKLLLDNNPSNQIIKSQNSTHLSIGIDALGAVGSHSIALQSSSDEPIFSSIYKILNPIGNVTLAGKTFCAKPSETMTFNLTISRGDQVNVEFSCGNGKTSFFFLPFVSSTVCLTINCSYSSLGKYSLSARVVNEVSQKNITKAVSIEKPLSSATMNSIGVTALGVPTLFTFTLQTDTLPVIPVSLSIDYGDGTIENTTLIPDNNITSVFKHYRVYPRYGIYTVKAAIYNNLSFVILTPVTIQIGQNITALDLYVNKNVLLVGETVTLKAECPTGVPVVLQWDMGDGTTITQYRPITYTYDDNFNFLFQAPSNKNQTLTPSLSLPNDFFINYTYKAAGVYGIKASASNIFSSTKTSLCPSTIVVNSYNNYLTCDEYSVSIDNSANLFEPQVVMRSSILSLNVSFQVKCSQSSDSYKPSFIWTAEKLIGDAQWKPELQVCESGLTSNTLLIKSNTLWYGTYRLNVSLVVNQIINGQLLPTTLQSNPDTSTYIKVIPSPLVAEITTSKEWYPSNDAVQLNLSLSRDPDVDSTNKTGFSFDVFCSYGTANNNLTYADMMKKASLVVKNDKVQGALYQLKNSQCFSSSASVGFSNDLDIAFLAKDMIVTDQIKFTVFASKDERASSASVKFSILLTNGSSSPLDSIDDLLNSGNTNAALQILDLVTNGLSSNGNDSEEAVNERTQVRGKIISCLNKVTDKMNDFDQLSKTTRVMSDVTSSPDEVTSDAKSNAAKGLNNAADKAGELTKDASIGQVQDVTLAMLSTAGQILPFAPMNQTNSSQSESQQRRKRSLFSKNKNNAASNESTWTCCEKLNGLCTWIEQVPIQDENDTNPVDIVDLKVGNWTDDECDLIYPCDLIRIQRRYKKYLDDIQAAENAVKKSTTTNGLGAVSTVGGILMGKQSPGQSLNLAAPGMNLTVASLNSDSSSTPDGFDIPKSAGGCGAMALESGNPFTYSTQPSDVSGNVKTLVLTTCDGQPIKVENSTEPFTLWMDGSPEEPTYHDFKLEYISNISTLNYHKTDLEFNDTSIFYMLRPWDTNPFEVFIKYGDYPNQTYYDWKTIVPNLNETGDRQYLVAPPQEVTKFNGSYRIGVTINNGSSVGDKNVSYSMYLYTASCKYWNENTTSWDTSGCTVGRRTTALKTECLCTHLTSFSGSFAVPVNTIDFNTVFTLEKFLESMPVFCTVIVLIVVYILIIVWARHMDKADIARWGALPLEDNLPTETYYYQMTVFTGMKKNAGTRSVPSFVLSGDDADTGVRNLVDGKRKEISTGSINNYVLSVDKCLGPLTFLRIWHDNSGLGSKKGWFLDQIEITDVQTGERFFFVCAQWMAVEEGDGMVERVIPVAGKEDMTQFSQLFSHSIRKKFSNDHMWFSIFSRPTRSTFTRVQRVSCCMSLLFMTMIVNCMFFKSADPDHATSVHIGPIEITLQQIYISVVSTCIILPPSVIIITIFKKSRPKQNSVIQTNVKTNTGWRSVDKESAFWSGSADKTKKQKLRDTIQSITTFHKRFKQKEGNENETDAPKKKKKAFTFPWWTVYIAWALVFFSIVLPGFFTILYSMSWGREKSLDWLKTFFLSFFQSVIVVQPVKVLLLTAFIACILKQPDIEEEEGVDTNILRPDEDLVETPKKNIKEIMKRRQEALKTPSILNVSKLQELRELRLKEIQIEAILKECLVYLLFIFVLYFISYQDKDQRSFTFVQNLQNQFFEAGKPTFSQIEKYEDVYGWINETLMQQLYTPGWYNSMPTKTWKESMQTSDHVTIRLGVARIRQLRIKENTCRIEKNFRKLIQHCRADYNWMDDDASSYMAGWKRQLTKPETKVAKKIDEDKHNPWLYRDSVELKSAPYMGKVNTYKGGGYTFNFYCNPSKTIMKLAELKNNNWLDVRTRAVVIEFTVYNANANLFGSVIMLLEFLANGAPVVSQEVKVFRVSSYVGPFGIIVILFQVIFVGFVIYFSVHSIGLMRKQKRLYFSSFWNVLEFLTVIMSITTIAMYGMKMIFGNTAMDVLKETGAGDYVNFITIGLWAETYGIVLAVVVFLATIKFINMLKFNRRLSMLTETIRFSIKDMKTFLITFFLYFFAFGQLGYLLFATKLESYSNFASVIETLFQFFIGSFTFSDYATAQPILGPIYFFMFVWAVCFGMQTMFLVIIIEAFQAVRKENQFKKNDYEVGEYIIGKFKGIIGRG